MEWFHSNYKPPMPKKEKPTEEVEDQLDKKKNTKLKNEIEIDDILSKQEEKAYNLLASL